VPHDPQQRLQKALAQLGLGSRRQVESWIRAGRLTVNGASAALGMRVRPTDQIRLDGRLVRRRAAAPRQAFVCHRSPGEPLERPREAPPAEQAAALNERLGERATLLERLPRTAGRRFIAVSPMPRHDGGLELVTSDGELAAHLQRAARELTAEFSVRLHGELSEADLARVRAGRLERGAPLTVMSCAASGGEGSNRWYSIVVRGASGMEVRRLFERSGAVVSRVLRTALGRIALDRSLARGRFRRLTPEELNQLLVGARSAAGPAAPPRRKPTGRRSFGR
jgi:23S rRNA pseudouridine2605 synthase